MDRYKLQSILVVIYKIVTTISLLIMIVGIVLSNAAMVYGGFVGGFTAIVGGTILLLTWKR